MNELSSLIIKRLETRKLLLTSLLHDSIGKWVAPDLETGLYHGKVHGVFALVPLEHADILTQKDLSVITQRGLSAYLRGLATVSLMDSIKEELFLIETEIAWVKECG